MTCDRCGQELEPCWYAGTRFVGQPRQANGPLEPDEGRYETILFDASHYHHMRACG